MGHRANYVLVEGGNARAFYDQWGALGCIYAFAGGPTDAVAITKGAEETAELLDWAFAEGGFLLDFDQKRAIVFGLPGEPISLEDLEGVEGIDAAAEIEESQSIDQALESGPEEFLRSLAPRWAGWHLTWDDRGVDSFAAHLGSRGINSIAVQPPSAKTTAVACEFQA